MKSRLLIALFVLSVVAGVACRRAIVSTPDVQVLSGQTVTLDVNASVWGSAPVHLSKMIPQDLVEPRLMEASTQEVQIQAITDGREIAFRIEWPDETQNDLPGPARFMDGVAVQLPSKIDPNVPAPQMGETGKSVEISYWRADWQAIVDGRADDITSIYPNAKPDHYPFNAKSLEKDPEAQRQAALRYSPARALGNGREGPRTQPVEDLVAEGPGTLTPGPNQLSKGKGVRTSTGWAVVITRPLPAGFSKESPSQIAFAVWQGSHGETGARKMRSGWVNLILK